VLPSAALGSRGWRTYLQAAPQKSTRTPQFPVRRSQAPATQHPRISKSPARSRAAGTRPGQAVPGSTVTHSPKASAQRLARVARGSSHSGKTSVCQQPAAEGENGVIMEGRGGRRARLCGGITGETTAAQRSQGLVPTPALSPLEGCREEALPGTLEGRGKRNGEETPSSPCKPKKPH